jgi:hypothetical protein
MNTLPVPHSTLAHMVTVYAQCEADIRAAYSLLHQAESLLRTTFKPDSCLFHLNRPEYRRYDDPERTIKGMKQDVWRALIDRMELRRILSLARSRELDRQIAGLIRHAQTVLAMRMILLDGATI